MIKKYRVLADVWGGHKKGDTVENLVAEPQDIIDLIDKGILEEFMAEESVQSPYAGQLNPDAPVFDYDKHQDETTIKTAAAILKIIGENAEKLVFNHDDDEKKMIENTSLVAQLVLNAMIDGRVPSCDFQKLSDSLSNVIFTIFQTVNRQHIEFEKELLARVIGTRNPGNGKYSKEYATLGDLFTALVNTRKAQGDNAEDYFFIKKEEAKPEGEAPTA